MVDLKVLVDLTTRITRLEINLEQLHQALKQLAAEQSKQTKQLEHLEFLAKEGDE